MKELSIQEISDLVFWVKKFSVDVFDARIKIELVMDLNVALVSHVVEFESIKSLAFDYYDEQNYGNYMPSLIGLLCDQGRWIFTTDVFEVVVNSDIHPKVIKLDSDL